MSCAVRGSRCVRPASRERRVEFGYGSGEKTFKGADDFGEAVVNLYAGASETRPYWVD